MAFLDDAMEDLLDSNESVEFPELAELVDYPDSKAVPELPSLSLNPLSESTFVTALYDIGREQLAPQYNNHRKFSTYLSWFKNLLTLPLNLVIFVPKSLEKFVLAHRSQFSNSRVKTQIVIREFNELPYAKNLQHFKDVLTNMENTNKGQIEMLLPEYNVVTFSKFPLVREVAQHNPYHSKYIFWIDAGYLRTPIAAQNFSFDSYRFTCVSSTRQVILSQTGTHPERLITKSAPSELHYPTKASKQTIPKAPAVHQVLRVSGETQLIRRIRSEWAVDSKEAPFVRVSEAVARDYFRGIPNDVNTAFWGGAIETVQDVCQLFEYMVCQALDWEILNNDQGILSLVIAEAPFLFQLIPGAGREHWFLLLNFANQVTPFVTQYPSCPHVKLFAMVTREIPDSKIRYWTDSVTHFGYNYEILERDRPWKGWAQRTKAYLDAARRAQGEKIPYLCFTDATDVFFCGSSWELYDKLRNSPSDALIGAERILYYNDTNSKRYQVERELDARAQGRYPFPNGGFLTGQTEALIEILERNLVAHDDQKGYCDLILETFGVNVLDDSEEPLRALQPLKCRFTIDYHGDFVANIPNYGLVGWIEEQIWNLDCGRPERVEPITQADQTSQTSRLIRPIALHFPGNSPAIHDFHDQLVKPRVQTVDEVWEVQDQSSDEEGWPWYYWVIIGLFILIVIIVLLILIFKNNSSSPNNSK